MRSNLALSIFMAAAVCSAGCLAGEDADADDVGILEASPITGPMEYDVAVQEYYSCLDDVGECEGQAGPLVEWSDDYTNYGSGFMILEGDVFFVEDETFDSASVGLNWEDINGNRQGICRLTFGGKSKGSCNKNLPEKHTIRYRIGLCDSDTDDCTNWSGYSAVTKWVYAYNAYVDVEY
jgi:hypothetical protein